MSEKQPQYEKTRIICSNYNICKVWTCSINRFKKILRFLVWNAEYDERFEAKELIKNNIVYRLLANSCVSEPCVLYSFLAISLAREKFIHSFTTAALCPVAIQKNFLLELLKL